MKTIILFLFLLVSTIIVSCGTRAEQTADPAVVPVSTGPVIRKSVRFPIHTSGRLYASAESRFSFKIPGIIGALLVDEGENVQPGQLLARLDLSEIDARLKQARSGYDKAKRDLVRVERLYADSVTTLEQLQNSETALEIASAELRVAEFNRRHSVIKAPSAGRILKRFVEAGELVSPGVPVFLFGSTRGNWIVRTGINDRDIINVTLGDSALITFDAYPGVTFNGIVSQIAAGANPMTGTFEVELEINASNRRLFSGFIAKIILLPRNKKDLALVPLEAFVEGDGNKGFVFMIDHENHLAQKVPVTVLRIVNNQLAISGGLDGIDEVVTVGAPYLSDRKPVQVIN